MASYLTSSGAVVLYDDGVVLPGCLSIGSHGYAQLTQGRGNVLFHRWLMKRTKGDGTYVDHINRNKLDCRRANLRVTTASGNNQNMSSRGRANAYPFRGRWQSRVKLCGVIHNLGTYDTAEEASAVAAGWKMLHFTEKVRT